MEGKWLKALIVFFLVVLIVMLYVSSKYPPPKEFSVYIRDPGFSVSHVSKSSLSRVGSFNRAGRYFFISPKGDTLGHFDVMP